MLVSQNIVHFSFSFFCLPPLSPEKSFRLLDELVKFVLAPSTKYLPCDPLEELPKFEDLNPLSFCFL